MSSPLSRSSALPLAYQADTPRSELATVWRHACENGTRPREQGARLGAQGFSRERGTQERVISFYAEVVIGKRNFLPFTLENNASFVEGGCCGAGGTV